MTKGKQLKASILLTLFLFQVVFEVRAYPIDGYELTGIRRLKRLELIQKGELKDPLNLPEGALKSLSEIKLNLYQTPKADSLENLPGPDPDLQKKLDALFPNLHESYSISILDITPGKPIRYARRQEERGFQPGSVGKLAVATALFCELENLYPDSFEQRRQLLKTKMVSGRRWAVYDQHTVPIYNPETGQFIKRQVNEKDVFSLYEWMDHMLSVSNNGAASVVWREAILMRVFGEQYLELSEKEAETYFTTTSKSELADIATSVVNMPLRELGISEDEWRLGTMFTRGATAYIPGKGGSLGSPRGLVKWMLALEKGDIIDPETSLEIKRLMYMTDRRIRYAGNESLKASAVYFKSGSLYKCKEEEGFKCGKYMGNVQNFMNSVAIIEHEDGTVYMIALMTNVLRKNSNIDHNALAGKVDKLIKA